MGLEKLIRSLTNRHNFGREGITSPRILPQGVFYSVRDYNGEKHPHLLLCESVYGCMYLPIC